MRLNDQDCSEKSSEHMDETLPSRSPPSSDSALIASLAADCPSMVLALQFGSLILETPTS